MRVNAKPNSGKGDALALIHTTGDGLAEELLCGKGPGDPGGKRAECEALTADSQRCLRL